MKNKFVNLEQLEKVLDSHGEEILQNEVEQKNDTNAQPDSYRAEQTISGSKFGKFKNSEALLEAYNNLQSDYTKKCQALAELSKNKVANEDKTKNSKEVTERDKLKEVSEIESLKEVIDSETLKQETKSETSNEKTEREVLDEKTERETLKDKVEKVLNESSPKTQNESLNLQNTKDFLSYAKSFFESYPQASSFKSQLFDLVNLDKGTSPLEEAWKEFASKNYFSYEQVFSNPDFLNKIYNNEQIKQKILGDYFAKIQSSNSPTLISSQKGNKTVLSPYEKPKTLTEAGKLASELLE